MCDLVKKNYDKDTFWDIYEKNLLIMTNFVTQVDFSTQIKSYSNTEGTLSGSANINQYVVIGTDYSDLPLGLDLTTTGITSSYGPNIYGTFSGTTGSTTFYFDDSNMDIANPYISAITSSNSGITQNVSAFDVITTIVEDGNSFDIYFSGVSFDLIPLNLDEYSPGLFSGVSYTYILNYISGTTYPWWFLKSGSTTWNEIKGRLKTDRITITQSATTGYVLTCLDSDGNATWQPSSGSSFSGGSGNCITDLYVTNVHGCSPINIQPTSSDDVYMVMGGGNVGIGTLAPSEKLEISGKTKTESIQITSGATPGYILTALDSLGNASWQSPSENTLVASKSIANNGTKYCRTTIESSGGSSFDYPTRSFSYGDWFQNWTTKIENGIMSGSFDLTTGIWTAPSDGFYFIQSSLGYRLNTLDDFSYQSNNPNTSGNTWVTGSTDIGTFTLTNWIGYGASYGVASQIQSARSQKTGSLYLFTNTLYNFNTGDTLRILFTNNTDLPLYGQTGSAVQFKVIKLT